MFLGKNKPPKNLDNKKTNRRSGAARARAMLSVIVYVATSSSDQTQRFTVRTPTTSTIQTLVDRLQTRFSQPLVRLQRADRLSPEPALVLFYDEAIEPGDEFFVSFEQRQKVQTLRARR